MSEELRHLLREEADRLEVPAPPTSAILSGGRRRRARRRTGGLALAAAGVAVVVGGVVGLGHALGGDPRGGSPDPAVTPSVVPPVDPSVAVSGTGVGALPFGTAADRAVAAVTERLGEPDLTVAPQRYARIAGQQGWFAEADDPLSLHWRYPVVSVTCWEELCLVFGGDTADDLRLRGWELASFRRWSGTDQGDPQVPDVRLAGTGVRLGDPWTRLHRAYPEAVVNGGEGNAVAVRSTPWPGIADGIGVWRLSGQWDFEHPARAPEGAVVTRLSAGEGPEPGCC